MLRVKASSDARGVGSGVGSVCVGVIITSSTPNFDQSSLGSDDSGICCSSSNPRLTRSAEFLDDDASCQFDETKSVESSDELESIQDPSMNAAMQSPLPEEESAAHEDPIEVEDR